MRMQCCLWFHSRIHPIIWALSSVGLVGVVRESVSVFCASVCPGVLHCFTCSLRLLGRVYVLNFAPLAPVVMASEDDHSVVKNLHSLRVVDLRSELEKRGLDKTGVKAVLLERLHKALVEEGHDPDKFEFENADKKATPKRLSRKQEHDAESETHSNMGEQHDFNLDASDYYDAKTYFDDPSMKEKRPASKKEEANTEANGMDNEDSINLTIGEDEEQLLNDEEDPAPDKHNKDAKEEDTFAASCKVKSKNESRVQSDSGNGSSSGKTGTASATGRTEDEDEVEEEEAIPERVPERSSTRKNEEERAGGGSGGSSTASAGGGNNSDPSSGAGSDAHEKSNPSKEPKNSVKEDKDKKVGPIAGANSSSRNLWVSGLSSTTRATDLKQVFSKYGKVIGAKVVTNARTPGARCYGYVTMGASEDASKCIQHLHRTELHGRMISVERAKGDSSGPPKKSSDSKTSSTTTKKQEDKKKSMANTELKSSSTVLEDKSTEKATETTKVVKEEKRPEERPRKETTELSPLERGRKPKDDENSHERQRSNTGSSHVKRSRSPIRRPNSTSSPRKPGVLTFAQIREERERQRLRERERERREEERRRREDQVRQREIERKQKEESVRLERERERLRVERDRLEKERTELMKLERERQRLEREKIEREREEIRRQREQFKIDEAHRSLKRQMDDHDKHGDMYENRKRLAVDRHFEPVRSDDIGRINFDADRREFKRDRDFDSRSNATLVAAGRLAGGGIAAEIFSKAERYDRNRRDSGRFEELNRRESQRDQHRDRVGVRTSIERVRDEKYDRNPRDHRNVARNTRTSNRPGAGNERDVRSVTSRDVGRHHGREHFSSVKQETRFVDRSSSSWHSSVNQQDHRSGPQVAKPSWGSGNASLVNVASRGTNSIPVGALMGASSGLYQQSMVPSTGLTSLNVSMSNSAPYGQERFDAYKPSVPLRRY